MPREAFALADRSGDGFLASGHRATFASILHHMGNFVDAESLLKESESILKRTQAVPFLYGLGNYHYCNLLLHQKRYEEVRRRANQALELAKEEHLLRDIALSQLCLGKLIVIEAQEGKPSDLSSAGIHYDQAVDGLRSAGQTNHLPRGLLSRAELHRQSGQMSSSIKDLNDVMAIAKRGTMRLYEADCHLEYARLYITIGENDNASFKPEYRDKAQKHWTAAKMIIDEIGYHRRDSDMREITEQLGRISNSSERGLL